MPTVFLVQNGAVALIGGSDKKKKGTELSVKAVKFVNNTKVWSAKELKNLKVMRSQGRSLISIATVLSRTPDAIRIKANRLGYHLA